MTTKAGFVAITGLPNSGKSTLLNRILGSKLSIVTDKPQTTRKSILGIYTEANLQIVFTDTPGYLIPKYKMQEKMMDYINESITESDLLLVIADSTSIENPREYFPTGYIDILNNFPKKKILLLNKTDLIHEKKKLLPIIAGFNSSETFDEVIPISALKNDNIEHLIDVIDTILPESPFYYDEEIISTQPQKFFVSEIIREKVFELLHDEIPYSTEVQVSEFKERESGKWYISADIIVERNSQKIIVLGKNGSQIKKIGTNARLEIEEHLQEQVFLELFVKVREKWRKNDNYLKNFGY